MKNIKEILESNEINIDEILFNDKKLKDLFIDRTKYLESNDIESDNLFIYDFLPLYIMEILESVNYNISNLDNKLLVQIRKYCNLLYRYTKVNPELIGSNPIFDLDEKILISLFGVKEIKDCLKLSQSSYEKAKTIYDSVMKNKTVSQKELYFLINYFTNNIGTKDKNFIKAQGNLIKKIIDNELDSSLKTKNFIMQFLAQRKFEQLGFCYKVYFSNDLKKEDSKKSLGVTGDHFILMNSNSLKDILIKTFNADNYLEAKKQTPKETTMLDFIETLYHELWHAFQLNKLENGIIDTDSLGHLENILIKEYIDKEDYIRNYVYQLSEKDAEINGYKDTMKFYQKFLPIEFLKLLKVLKFKKNRNENKKTYSFKKDEKGEVYLNEVYIAKYIDEIIKNNPNLLNKYSGLKLIYDSDGNPLDIVNLINNLKKKGFEFEKYVIARILNGNLRNLNINNIQYDSYKNMLLSFVHISKDTIKSIDIINESLNKDKELTKNYKDVVREKLFIIFEIYSFIKKSMLNIKFNTNEIIELYKMLDSCFMEINNRIKIVGINLNNSELENYSLRQLIGEDNYGSNKMV